jgi:holo-[acyl-carrier protein] synthase
MIAGIGVDMVSVARMRRSYERTRNSERLANKILTSTELVGYNDSTDKALYLAKCWAVKEATFKCLGFPYDWLSISYVSPNVIVEGVDGNFHLSLSDDNGYVIAFVIMEK